MYTLGASPQGVIGLLLHTLSPPIVDLHPKLRLSNNFGHAGLRTRRPYSGRTWTHPQSLRGFGARNLPTRRRCVAGMTTSAMSDDVKHVYDDLLTASKLLDEQGHVFLTPQDIETALTDMHLQDTIGVPRGAEHPKTYLPASLYSADPVNVTNLVLTILPNVFRAHPIFRFMLSEVLGNDDFSKSVFFGTRPRDSTSLDFSALCRRLVASIYIFELLLALDQDKHRQLVKWYESLYSSARHRIETNKRPRSIRDALLGFFLALKGESVLASINVFEKLRRLSNAGKQHSQTQVLELSNLLNAIMKLNIFEAVLSNLSFAFWPDNARAGMALLLTPLGQFDANMKQKLNKKWFKLYLAWNANFIWPSHYFSDMMCFTMLVTPTISLGDPDFFQYNRAHSLFWVVRSNQLTRFLRNESSTQIPCFQCRQLEPASDRQPITSRTAVLTRASGEQLATSIGEDVSEGSGVWRRLVSEILPQQLRSAIAIYQQMPKESPTKLKQF